MRALALALLLLIPLHAAAADLRLHLLDQSLHFDAVDPTRPGNMRTATTAVVVGTTAALILYDVYLATHHKTTESRVVTDYAWRYSTIPLLAGALCGHLFVNQPSPKNRVWPWGLAILGGVLTWDLTKGDGKSWVRHPGIWLGIGIGTGALTWGQRGP